MKNCRLYRLCPLLCRALIVPALICSFAAASVIPAAAAEPGDASAADTSSDASASSDAAGAADPASVAAVNVPELILSKCYLLESDNYENIADGYYQAILLTEESGKKFPALHITGGGGKNEFLNELTAKAINRPVIVGPIEGTAIGNVLMQMIHSGEIASLEQGRRIIKDSFGCKEVLP